MTVCKQQGLLPILRMCKPLSCSVSDLSGHHQEWWGSTTTTSHDVASFDFATVSGCDQLVVGPTHAHGETLDLLMTAVLDQVWVAVVAPIYR